MADGFVGFFAILRGLLLLRFLPITYRLIVVMSKASPYVVCALLVVLTLWLMIASSASALFGHEVVALRSMGSAMAASIYALGAYALTTTTT